MMWKNAANITQLIGGIIIVWGMLQGDNKDIQFGLVAARLLTGTIIVLVGYIWHYKLDEMYRKRSEKRIRYGSSKNYEQV